MDNLRALLNIYFLDRDFNEILSSIGSISNAVNSPLAENRFVSSFLKYNRMHGSNVISSIGSMSSQEWFKDDSGRMSVFNLIFKAANIILDIQDDQPVCKFENYLRWDEMTERLGEDLFTTAFFASKAATTDIDYKSFGWKPYISTNSLWVNSVIKKGLAELHAHLYASSDVFNINWISLMNSASVSGFSGLRDILSDDDKIMLLKSMAMRFYLFVDCTSQDCGYRKTVSEMTMSVLNADSLLEAENMLSSIRLEIDRTREIDSYHFDQLWNEAIDYLIPKHLSVDDSHNLQNAYIIGERLLLYRCFSRLLDNPGENENFAIVFYAYLVAKNKFRDCIIQNRATKGFSNFELYTKRKDAGISPKSIYSSLCPYTVVHGMADNSFCKIIELRITPGKTINSISKHLKNLNRSITGSLSRTDDNSQTDNDTFSVGFILHFIKKADSPNDLADERRPRNWRARESSLKAAEAIESLFAHNSKFVQGGRKDATIRYKIIGIDAAGSEFGCRPEVFGPVFRRLKYINRDKSNAMLEEIQVIQPGRTFHVGEDFYDIVDGLRAIDECVEFLELSEGDRIGHAIALGENVRDFYLLRHCMIVIPKQILLDNVVWLLIQIERRSIKDNNGITARLIDSYIRLLFEIYQKNNIDYHLYYNSVMLRGDNPSLRYPNDAPPLGFDYYYRERTKDIRSNHEVTSLFMDYYFNKDVKQRGERIEEYRIQESDIETIAEIQAFSRASIASKGIAVETNPTSNLFITDVGKFSNHPVTRFNNYGLTDRNDNDNPRIPVSINTDDQGVFSTSLEKEYGLIALSLSKMKDNQGRPIYSNDEISDWLNHIREMAFTSTFIKNGKDAPKDIPAEKA